jgi:hypothetical protein
MPARCTTRRKIPSRISWRNVVCAAMDGHRIVYYYNDLIIIFLIEYKNIANKIDKSYFGQCHNKETCNTFKSGYTLSTDS